VRPYYEDDGTVLFHADFLTCPALTGDLFLADPPYARSGGMHSGRRDGENKAGDYESSEQFWLYWFRDVAKRLGQACADDGCGFVFTDYRTVALVARAFALSGTGWGVSQCLVWDRECIGMGTPFRASHELIAFCRGPDFRWEGRRDMPNVLRCRWPYSEHEYHPAEKPVALYARLIETFTRPGQVVFDPFAGAGSSLVAAKRLGRRAVGVEADARYCEVAVRRLQQQALPLFQEAAG
jgi:DNA methylase